MLILLTLTSVGGELTNILSDFFASVFTVLVIVPFAISGVEIIRAKLMKEVEKIDKHSRIARQYTIYGFMYLIAVVAILASVNIYEWVGPTKTFNGTMSMSCRAV